MFRKLFLLALLCLAPAAAFAWRAFAQSAAGVPAGRERAIEIAREDAMRAYRSLEDFEIVVKETEKRWLIVFEPRSKNLDGDGPTDGIGQKAARF